MTDNAWYVLYGMIHVVPWCSQVTIVPLVPEVTMVTHVTTVTLVPQVTALVALVASLVSRPHLHNQREWKLHSCANRVHAWHHQYSHHKHGHLLYPPAAKVPLTWVSSQIPFQPFTRVKMYLYSYPLSLEFCVQGSKFSEGGSHCRAQQHMLLQLFQSLSKPVFTVHGKISTVYKL